MTICINFQNLTHLFWTTIIAFIIYIIWLLYCVVKQYRLDRFERIKAVQILKQRINLKRKQHLKVKENISKSYSSPAAIPAETKSINVPPLNIDNTNLSLHVHDKLDTIHGNNCYGRYKPKSKPSMTSSLSGPANA